jgi:hypothetical protein
MKGVSLVQSKRLCVNRIIIAEMGNSNDLLPYLSTRMPHIGEPSAFI